MAVTINGTTGVAVPLGSASSPAETNTTSATTGIYYPTSTTLGLSTNGTNAVTIDASQNVGVGTSSPSTKFTVQTAALTDAMRWTDNTNSTGILSTASGLSTMWTTTALGFGTGAGTYTERMRIDSSGNVGIGTSSPSNKLTVAGNGNFTGVLDVVTSVAGAYGLRIIADSANTYAGIQFTNNPVTAPLGYYRMPAANVHAWYDSTPTERMRIDSSGNVMVGQTSFSSTTVGVGINPAGLLNIAQNSSVSGGTGLQIYSTAASAFRFYVDMAGTIHATSTSITAISDVSLKTNVKPLETGLAEVMALQPRRFDWIDGNATNVVGFIAQEVESVLPDLVAPFKYNEEETKLGLKMGDMIPTLVKAIQELSAEVEALKAKVGA